MPERRPDGLIPYGPECEHGNTIGDYAVMPGSTIWAPECKDSRGSMRPHDVN